MHVISFFTLRKCLANILEQHSKAIHRIKLVVDSCGQDPQVTPQQAWMVFIIKLNNNVT